MAETTLSAGDPIESRCTKCRKLTNHIIVALDDSGPAKVECNTCGGQHKYRPPAAPKAPAKKRATRKTVDPKEVERQEWESLRPNMNEAAAADYAMSGSYKLGSLVKHATFGLGLVQDVSGDRKMVVLFQDGKKLMRCA